FPCRSGRPRAPAAAARADGVPSDLARLEPLIRRRQAPADVLLVEGAGGLLVPIRDAVTYADLAARLGLPLLVVAANRLGTINHCALTARAAAAAGVAVLGVVPLPPH